MRAILLTLTALVVLSLFVTSSSHTISLQKSQHIYYQNGETHSEILAATSPVRRLTTGSTISLNGGLLVLGAYFMNITVGGTTYNVLLDTGSSNVVLPNAPQNTLEIACGSDVCNNCIPANATASWASEFTCAFGDPICYGPACAFEISYGGGSLQSNGTLYSGQICISPDLCAPGVFGVSNTPPSTDGLIGFASDYNSCNPTCVPTPLDNLVNAGQTSNVFGLCLNPSNGGILDIGEVVSSRYTGELQYAPMEVDRWFNIYLEDISVGDLSIGVNPLAYRTTNDVIGSFVDSGTSIIISNQLIYDGIQAAFQSDKYCHLPGLCGKNSFFNQQCINQTDIGTDLSKYPDISFSILGQNGQTFNLPVPATSYLLPLEGYYCLGLEATASLGVVLGDVFMENFYIVFDRTNQQLGFAPVANACAL